MAETTRWRRKPVEIEAMQWDGSVESAREIFKWAGPQISYHATSDGSRVGMWICGFERYDSYDASPGDWIIKDAKGEVCPCKPDIFEQTYEAVRDAA